MILPASQVHDAGELASLGGGRGGATRLSSALGTRTPAKRAGSSDAALQARLDRGPHGIPRGCQLSSQSCNGGSLDAQLSDRPADRPHTQTRPGCAHLLAVLQECHRLAVGFAAYPASYCATGSAQGRCPWARRSPPPPHARDREQSPTTRAVRSDHRTLCRAPERTHAERQQPDGTPSRQRVDCTDHKDQATRSSRQGGTPPKVLDNSGGRSPLIIKDLDFYPQPPTNTHSPTLNSEEPF